MDPPVVFFPVHPTQESCLLSFFLPDCESWTELLGSSRPRFFFVTPPPPRKRGQGDLASPRRRSRQSVGWCGDPGLRRGAPRWVSGLWRDLHAEPLRRIPGRVGPLCSKGKIWLESVFFCDFCSSGLLTVDLGMLNGSPTLLLSMMGGCTAALFLAAES